MTENDELVLTVRRNPSSVIDNSELTIAVRHNGKAEIFAGVLSINGVLFRYQCSREKKSIERSSDMRATAVSRN